MGGAEGRRGIFEGGHLKAIEKALGRELTPLQYLKLLELKNQYGEAKFSQAAARLSKSVADPVAFLLSILAGRPHHKKQTVVAHANLGMKKCRQCAFAWNAGELHLFVCPRCIAGIVRGDRIDPELYSRFMRSEPVQSPHGINNDSNDLRDVARTCADLSPANSTRKSIA